jgi:hypothetical protein
MACGSDSDRSASYGPRGRRRVGGKEERARTLVVVVRDLDGHLAVVTCPSGKRDQERTRGQREDQQPTDASEVGFQNQRRRGWERGTSTLLA